MCAYFFLVLGSLPNGAGGLLPLFCHKSNGPRDLQGESRTFQIVIAPRGIHGVI